MKMNSFRFHYNGLKVISLASILIFAGCQGAQKGDQGSSDNLQVDDKETLIKEVFNYPLPTSFEVTAMLVDAGAPFIVSLGNDPEKAKNYITQTQKALNLGIYGADLCYASTYNQSQETMSYLNASKKIIDELRIETSFNAHMVERIEANIQQKDSLIKIISDSFYDTYNYLLSNKQDKTSALIMSGSWLEALYITTQIAITAHKNDKMLHIISSHKNSLKKLIELMEPLKADADVSGVYNDLVSLQNQYNSFSSDKLSASQLTELGASVDKIRQNYIR